VAPGEVRQLHRKCTVRLLAGFCQWWHAGRQGAYIRLRRAFHILPGRRWCGACSAGSGRPNIVGHRGLSRDASVGDSRNPMDRRMRLHLPEARSISSPIGIEEREKWRRAKRISFIGLVLSANRRVVEIWAPCARRIAPHRSRRRGFGAISAARRPGWMAGRMEAALRAARPVEGGVVCARRPLQRAKLRRVL